MAGQALTPELALDYLGELSTDIEAAVVLDRSKAVAAATEQDPQRAARLGGHVAELLERAGAAGDGAGQVEISTADGSVYAVRGEHWSLAVVTRRRALPSLMFYDLRSVIGDLGDGA